MSFSTSSPSTIRFARIASLASALFLVSLFTLAQVTLTYRLLNGYALAENAPISKGKPTFFVFDKVELFASTFNRMDAPAAATTTKRPDRSASPTPDFGKDLVIGIVLPTSGKPPKLSISRVFVQDSVLTVRYIKIADTTTTATQPMASSPPTQPMLLITLPKQTVLKTKFVENGKVVHTLKKQDD